MNKDNADIEGVLGSQGRNYKTMQPAKLSEKEKGGMDDFLKTIKKEDGQALVDDI